MASQIFFNAVNWRVDRASSIVRGVSIIAEGEAKGHGIQIDHTTLEQVKECAEGYDNGLKVKLDHGSGVSAIVGTVNNFRIDGQKLLGDLHLLKSHPQHDFILELIDAQPDTFGLSIHFSGENEEIDGQQFARVSEIFSVDLVGEPAANASGIFSAKKPKKKIMPKKTKAIELTSTETATASAPEAGQTFNAAWDPETQKFIISQAELNLDKEVDNLKKSMGEKTQVTDPGVHSDKVDPLPTSGLEARIAKLEEAFSKYQADFEAFKVPAKEEAMAAQDPQEPDEDDKAPAKQSAVESYSTMEEKIRLEVIKEFAKIGVSAIKANPENSAPDNKLQEKNFEQLIAEQIAAGKSNLEAVKFCVKNHQKAHEAFLNNGGGHFKI